jgi:uncharacterized protein YchJ
LDELKPLFLQLYDLGYCRDFFLSNRNSIADLFLYDEMDEEEKSELKILSIHELYQILLEDEMEFNNSNLARNNYKREQNDYDSRYYKPSEPIIAAPKIGRNDPCVCGSGKKYKKCCMGEI